MIKLRRAKRCGLLASLFLLPFSLLCAVLGFAESGEDRWLWVSLVIGGWGFFTLFAISYLFQALVALIISIYAFSQGMWLLGIIAAALTPYLFYASGVSDEDIAKAFEETRTFSPKASRILDLASNLRVSVWLALVAVLFSLVFVMLLHLLTR